MVVVFKEERGSGGRAVWQNHDRVSFRVNVRIDVLEKSVAAQIQRWFIER